MPGAAGWWTYFSDWCSVVESGRVFRDVSGPVAAARLIDHPLPTSSHRPIIHFDPPCVLRPLRATSRKLLKALETDPEAEVAGSRKSRPPAACRAADRRDVHVRTAADDTGGICRTCLVCGVDSLTAGIRRILVQTPLADVPVHVEQTPRVWREAPDLGGPAPINPRR